LGGAPYSTRTETKKEEGGLRAEATRDSGGVRTGSSWKVRKVPRGVQQTEK